MVSVFSLFLADGVGGGLRAAGLDLACFHVGEDSPHRVFSIGILDNLASWWTCPGPLVVFWGFFPAGILLPC